jgi:hypothetical protein
LSDFMEGSLGFFCSIYRRRTGTIGPVKNGGRAETLWMVGVYCGKA